MRLQYQNLLAIAGLVSKTNALASFSPGPSYSVGVPSGSSISSSANGPIYLQLSAPTSYQWVGLGIGSQMSGATIFVMYSDGNGNVTISPRTGSGHVEPRYSSSLASGVTLLGGSGIVNGRMIANILCTTCKLSSGSASSTNSPFIAAWSTGSAIDSSDTSYSINQHSDGSYTQVRLDLTQAAVSANSNPFVGSATTTASASSPTSTSTGDDHGNDGNDGNSNSNSGNSGATVVGNSLAVVHDYQKAHGIIMGVVVVLLFPIGGIWMRMGGNMFVHSAIQMFSLVALLCGLGLGIKLAEMKSYVRFPFFGGGRPNGFPGGYPNGFPGRPGIQRRSELFNNSHTIFGLVICVLFLLQPVFGIIHHIQFRRNFARAGVSHLHIWFGRILMVLAVINGGLGLRLAANSKNGEIAYGVVAGVVGLIYIVLTIVRRKGVPMVLRKENSGERNVELERIAPAYTQTQHYK